MYRSNPCLWKVKSKEYMDRDKNDAYETLVKKRQQVDPTANRDLVTKKNNSFRSTYRKELMKVKKSERSGSGSEEVYVPSLWYFQLLSFLGDQETPWQTISNLDEDSEKQVSDNSNLSKVKI
jgi:hypothetical protein